MIDYFFLLVFPKHIFRTSKYIVSCTEMVIERMVQLKNVKTPLI